MQIEETSNFDSFDVIDNCGETIEFWYKNRSVIGINRQQAKQLRNALNHWLEEQELPE